MIPILHTNCVIFMSRTFSPESKLHHDYIYTHNDYSALLPGGRLNKKDGLTRYGDSHVKYKTS